MRIFKRGDKPATVTESTSVTWRQPFLIASYVGSSCGNRICVIRLRAIPFDPSERYNPLEVKLR